MEENRIIDPLLEFSDQYDHVTYLVGAMQFTAEKDGGQAKREDFINELLMRNVFPINPVTLEKLKTGMTVQEATEKIQGWIASGHRELIRECGRNVWKGRRGITEDGNIAHIAGDLDYTKMSDWITFILNKGDNPCGSYMEVGVAVDHNIPIYLITEIPKKDLKQSLILGIEAVNGEFFENPSQYYKFIDEKYKLKRKQSNLKEEVKEEKK